MVLFVCRECLERFPTFHPEHPPPEALEVTRTCNITVEVWDQKPDTETPVYAPLHTGICRRCALDLASLKYTPMEGVSKFGGLNAMGPLFGMDDIAIRKELAY